jgi:hypothetical protein
MTRDLISRRMRGLQILREHGALPIQQTKMESGSIICQHPYILDASAAGTLPFCHVSGGGKSEDFWDSYISETDGNPQFALDGPGSLSSLLETLREGK